MKFEETSNSQETFFAALRRTGMNTKTIVLILAMLATVAVRPAADAFGGDGPSTQPARPYRLLLRGFADGNQFRQIFVIVTPEGEPVLSSVADLKRMIDLVVKAPATLNWEPSDMKIGHEPLDDPAELKSLIDHCKVRQIEVKIIPAG